MNEKPWPLVIKCASRNDWRAREMLQNAKKLRESRDARSRVFINPHLTKQQAVEEKALRTEVKQRKENGEDVMIKNGKIVSRQE